MKISNIAFCLLAGASFGAAGLLYAGARIAHCHWTMMLPGQPLPFVTVAALKYSFYMPLVVGMFSLAVAVIWGSKVKKEAHVCCMSMGMATFELLFVGLTVIGLLLPATNLGRCMCNQSIGLGCGLKYESNSSRQEIKNRGDAPNLFETEESESKSEKTISK